MANVIDFFNKVLEKDYWVDDVGLCLTTYVVHPQGASGHIGRMDWNDNGFTAAQVYSLLTTLDFADSFDEYAHDSHYEYVAEQLGLDPHGDWTDEQEEAVRLGVVKAHQESCRSYQEDDLRVFRQHFADELQVIKLSTGDQDADEDNCLNVEPFNGYFIDDYHCQVQEFHICEELGRFWASVTDEQLLSPLFNGTALLDEVEM